MENRIDVILVACGMVIGFIVIIMHLTGLWPCSVINKLDKTFSSNHSNTSVLGGLTFKNFVEETHSVLTNLFRCK
jgi:hypothetical protein